MTSDARNGRRSGRGRAAGVSGGVAGAIGWLMLLAVVGYCLLASAAFIMATDHCSISSECDYGMLNWAYVFALGGCGAAFLVAIVGSVVSSARATPAFYWPYVGIAICAASMACAGAALDAVDLTTT